MKRYIHLKIIFCLSSSFLKSRELHGAHCIGRGFDRGKQGGGLDPGKGDWLKTYIAARASPLILIGLKTGGVGLGVVDSNIAGATGPSSGQRVSQPHAAILVTQLSLATRKCSRNRF